VHRPAGQVRDRARQLRLADCIYRLRRLMEARMGNGGRREFIQVLRENWIDETERRTWFLSEIVG
jgi:hypothetical protein